MQIHRDKGHAKKLEIGVMQPQAKGYLELPEAGREKVGFSLSTFREVWPYWSLNFVFVISTTVTKKNSVFSHQVHSNLLCHLWEMNKRNDINVGTCSCASSPYFLWAGTSLPHY